ncbi:MAG TPA: low affinity iron permease family protein [Sphingomicrobium sp.]|jgi:low affinity Fe/Cu permease|nr:low affinity iron permease family protein [Sphingomicrobium sp.]
MGNTTQTGNASNGSERSWLYRLGCDASAWFSDLSAHPYAQIGVLVICIAWFALGLGTDLLTAALSILAISLSQMVLNRQNEREAEAHRRDVAMHAKLDELIIAVRRANNEMAGIEELPEEAIEELREQTRNLANGHRDEADVQRSAQKGRADSSG